MSSLSKSDIYQLQLEQISIYLQYAAYVMYLFECCITFTREVGVIWGRKWSITTWIYVLTRYSAVMLTIIGMVPVWGLKATQYLGYIAVAIQFVCLACFSALRIYALLDGKILIAGIVFFLNLVPLGANIVEFVKAVVSFDDLNWICSATSTVSEDVALGRMFSLSSRISVIVGDILVLLVTWSKSIKLYREARQSKIEAPLATLLFRDGTFYFIILLVLNVLQVMERNIPPLFVVGISEPFFQTLPQITICRFILNLRQTQSTGNESFVSRRQSLTLRFVGNVGESLQFGASDGEEEEDDFVEPSSWSAQAEESTVLTMDRDDVNEVTMADHDSTDARLVSCNAYDGWLVLGHSVRIDPSTSSRATRVDGVCPDIDC
ncbi:hypothetical protein BDY19DRAFT_993466 [Irpex rosettiformis]|uniref:Uncharacterized protein n=1 Tax=Irpex rosettiformis TaxID=378272 RepID=A0ACB8U552_9APHY|nr:hypothetical protein BDY19DRAFT_993466 [Irpex rosettiformis]